MAADSRMKNLNPFPSRTSVIEDVPGVLRKQVLSSQHERKKKDGNNNQAGVRKCHSTSSFSALVWRLQGRRYSSPVEGGALPRPAPPDKTLVLKRTSSEGQQKPRRRSIAGALKKSSSGGCGSGGSSSSSGVSSGSSTSGGGDSGTSMQSSPNVNNGHLSQHSHSHSWGGKRAGDVTGPCLSSSVSTPAFNLATDTAAATDTDTVRQTRQPSNTSSSLQRKKKTSSNSIVSGAGVCLPADDVAAGGDDDLPPILLQRSGSPSPPGTYHQQVSLTSSASASLPSPASSTSHHSPGADRHIDRHTDRHADRNKLLPTPVSNVSLDSHAPSRAKHSSSSSQKSRLSKFHKVFKNIPLEEEVINSFSCAYVSDILLQGQMYVTKQWICFYSSIFGQKTQLQISTCTVTRVTKEKTAFFIPNAVGVETDKDEKYVFGSLLSRDAAFRLLQTICYNSEDQQPPVTSPSDELDPLEPSDFSSDDETHSETSSSADVDDRSDVPSQYASCPACHSSHHTPHHASHLASHHASHHGAHHAPHHAVHQSASRLRFILTFIASYLREYKPKTIVILSSILVILLIITSIFLSYKIDDLQQKISHSSSASPWLTPSSPDHQQLNIGSRHYAEMYKLREQEHAASVMRMQTILNANMQMLNEVRNSLESLNLLIRDEETGVMKDTVATPYPSHDEV